MEFKELIEMPLKELSLSEEFIIQSHVLGFYKLSDIFKTDPEILIKKEDFSYRWLAELSKFLLERDLLHLLQPMKGKSSY